MRMHPLLALPFSSFPLSVYRPLGSASSVLIAAAVHTTQQQSPDHHCSPCYNNLEVHLFSTVMAQPQGILYIPNGLRPDGGGALPGAVSTSAGGRCADWCCFTNPRVVRGRSCRGNEAVRGCRYGQRSERKGIRCGERVDEERVRLKKPFERTGSGHTKR